MPGLFIYYYSISRFLWLWFSWVFFFSLMSVFFLSSYVLPVYFFLRTLQNCLLLDLELRCMIIMWPSRNFHNSVTFASTLSFSSCPSCPVISSPFPHNHVTLSWNTTSPPALQHNFLAFLSPKPRYSLDRDGSCLPLISSLFLWC